MNTPIVEKFVKRTAYSYTSYDSDEVYKLSELELNSFCNSSIDEILNVILSKEKRKLSSKDIPIYSDFYDCTDKLCIILDAINKQTIDFESLGKMLLERTARETAIYKYGETHAKAGACLGLCNVVKTKKIKTGVVLSNAGKFYLENIDKREPLITRLLLCSLIVQEILKNSNNKEYKVERLMSELTKKTMVRRMPNIKTFFDKLVNNNEYDFSIYIHNVSFEVGGDCDGAQRY